MHVLADMNMNPLIPQDKVDSEISNIESEFAMKYTFEYRRLDNVISETMNIEHPFKIFGTGNTKTLKDIFNKNNEFKDDPKFTNRNALL